MEPKIETIRELIAIVEEAQLAELTVESGGHAITVRTTQAAPAPAVEHVVQAAPAPGSPAGPETSPPVPTSNQLTIVSPMVGVFYRSSAPGSPPLIEVGHVVEVGTTIGIIEAMKVFNEIPSDHRGRVVAIPVKNEALVQLGETLVVLERM